MIIVYILAVILIISTVALVWIRPIISAIKILSLQSFLLGVVALMIAHRTGLVDLYIMAALTIVVKAIAIPWTLYRTMRKIDIRRATTTWINREISLVIAAGLVMVGYYVTGHVGTLPHTSYERYLPISISMLLIGLFIMISHRKAIMQGIGLIVMENGLFLVGLVSTYGMPFLVEIGISLDVFVVVILIGMLTYRIDQTFQTTDTDQLRSLRG